jgi:hypothetical protein
MILAVAFVAFMGAMAQVVRVFSKSSRLTDALARYEALFFEIESGLRPDLAGYGGRGVMEDQYHYQIKAEKGREFSAFLKGRLSWKGEKEFLDLEVLASKAPVQ